MENLTQSATERVECFQEKIDIANRSKISEETRDAVVLEYQSNIDMIINFFKNL